jgi:2-hydroxychromene-2-carboxylate isomerase
VIKGRPLHPAGRVEPDEFVSAPDPVAVNERAGVDPTDVFDEAGDESFMAGAKAHGPLQILRGHFGRGG